MLPSRVSGRLAQQREELLLADFLGFAATVTDGGRPEGAWQNSSNFDIAVSDGDDNHTRNYFSSLSDAAFAAWAARGVTSVAQTINPGNPACPNFASAIGSPDILSFTPAF